MSRSFISRVFGPVAIIAMLGCGNHGEKTIQKFITIQPKSGKLALAQPQTFVVTSFGVDSSRIGWKSDLGTILQTSESTISFQAPETPGVVTITAYDFDEPTIYDAAVFQIYVPDGVGLTISPQNNLIYPLQTMDFNVSAQGTYLQKFIWSVDAGTYQIKSPSSIQWTAPNIPGTYGIHAHWAGDSSVAGTVIQGVLTPPLVLILTPPQVMLPTNQLVNLYLQISTNEMGGVDTSVTWSSDGGLLSVGSGGQGAFSSATPGVYHITVKSNAYPSVRAASMITVQ